MEIHQMYNWKYLEELWNRDVGSSGPPFQKKLELYLVERIVPRTPASFVERAIRTLKDGIAVPWNPAGMAEEDWF